MRRLKVGDRVRIHGWCGLASRKEGTIITPITNDRGIPTNCPGAYQPLHPDERVVLTTDGERYILHKHALELI